MISDGRLQRQAQYLNRLQRKHNDFENKFAELMLTSNELEEQLEALDRAYRKLQFQLKCKSQTSEKVFFGKDAAVNNDKQTTKMIKVLEQRLNGKRNRLSMIKHGNTVLTGDIDEARLQRVAANASSEKLHAIFDQRQKQMAASMENANKSNDVRLKSSLSKNALAAEAERLEEEQRAEMERLKIFLESFQQENEFVRSVARKKLNARMDRLQNGSLSVKEEKTLRKQMHSMSAGLAEERKKIKSATDKMFTYETAFRRLKEETKETSMTKIVEIFVNREDENFSLYNYLQRVNQQLKTTEKQMNFVEESIQKYLQDEEGSSNQRKNRLQQIESRRDWLQQKVLRTDEKHKHNIFTQNLWATAVEKFILQTLGFSDISTRIAEMANPSSKMLLQKLIAGSGENVESASKRNTDSTIVTESNISVVLSLIELCVMEIYAEYQEITTGKIGDFGVRVSAGPPKGNPLNVDAPDLVNEDEDHRMGAAPLSSDSLRVSFEAQLKQQLARRTPTAPRRKIQSS